MRAVNVEASTTALERAMLRRDPDRTQSHNVDNRSAQFEDARGGARDIEGHDRRAL